jgi:fructose-1,6-bisphosphatase/sedoheptulose 1,7-bisphosphatase-like protein
MAAHGHSGSHNSFSVHIDTLRTFEKNLVKQIDELKATKNAVRDLASHQVRLGNFLEAKLLVERHDTTIAEMEALLDGVRDALIFAGDVTHTVEKSYRQGDVYVADGLSVSSGAV